MRPSPSCSSSDGSIRGVCAFWPPSSAGAISAATRLCASSCAAARSSRSAPSTRSADGRSRGSSAASRPDREPQPHPPRARAVLLAGPPRGGRQPAADLADAEGAGRPLAHGTPHETNDANRYAGCDDLNVQAAIEQMGVLFLEGEGEPGEIGRIKRELATKASDCAQTGTWLGEAMQSTWNTAAKALLRIEPLADLLAERHRIITANWQNACLNTIIAALLTRANEILDQIDFT